MPPSPAPPAAPGHPARPNCVTSAPGYHISRPDVHTSCSTNCPARGAPLGQYLAIFSMSTLAPNNADPSSTHASHLHAITCLPYLVVLLPCCM
ncbi:hypothetical protein Taro_006839 [Colocasia esculenta]|uniref:Uncharacterized protein n=1 Tax=Colocasia esculenta TaxID=4460 RepID=A0A843U1Y0_COLES|nr:hypothetical protein [Colocasia esculenta]